MNGVQRRGLLRAGMGGAGLLATARLARAAQAAPIRVGFITALTSSLAIVGREARRGAEIAVAQINTSGGVRGRPIELSVIDDRGTPNDALAAVHEFTGNGIQLVVGGGQPTATFFAELQVVRETGGLLLATGPIGMNVTHDRFDAHMFRVGNNDYEELRALANLAVQRYPDVTRWAGLIMDNETMAQGYAMFGELVRQAYAARGRQVSFAEVIRSKFGNPDFKPHIAQLLATDANGLFNAVFGDDSISFYTQARAFGLNAKLRVIMDRGQDFPGAKAMKRNTPDNLWVVSAWYPGNFRDLPASRALYDAYVAQTGDRYPAGTLSFGHVPLSILAQAIDKAEGATDPAVLTRVIEQGSFATARGDMRFRPQDHQAVAYISLVQLGPSETEPGFRVADAALIPGADMLEPPSPGMAFKV